MGACPYTFVRNLFGFLPKKEGSTEASQLRVTVRRDGDLKVDVALPAHSARWLIDLIPDDVIKKIREENIPLDRIQSDLAQKKVLLPQKIFILNETHRTVEVWLE